MGGLQDKYLGVGLKYPIKIDQYGKGETNSGLSQVGDDILVLLSTNIGERYFLPDYGSRINEALFEPIDEIAESLLRTFTEEAITRWEKRVKFVNMEAEFINETGKVLLTVSVKVLATNKVESYVYPFYRELKY